jgi:hypothetical protein
MKVHNILGNGFQEMIYQRWEQEMPIYYDEKAVGTRRADFIVGDSVLIELKAVIKLEDVHMAQGLNYLEACKIEKDLPLNFGSPSPEVKRLFRKRREAVYNRTYSNPDHP